MKSTIKNIFFSILLAAITALFWITRIPDFFIWLLFFIAAFFMSLSFAQQSFTLARLPFIFLNGIVFFLLLFQNNLANEKKLILAGIAFFLIFRAIGFFAFLFKSLPNIPSEEYEKVTFKYETVRNVIFVFLFLTLFIWYINAFVVYLFYGYPFFSALLIIFFVTFLLTSFVLRVYMVPFRENKKLRFSAIYSWVISLVIVQAGWVIGFWPFGYLTAALILIIIYYMIFVVMKEYFFGELNKINIAKEIFFWLIVVFFVFYFSRWFSA